MKVLYMTNYPSPYRVDFFSELGKYCNLSVVFEQTMEEQLHRNPDWFCHCFENFEAIYLKNTRWKQKYYFEILNYIKSDYDVIIVGYYASLIAQIAIAYMYIHQIPFYIETDGGIPKTGHGFKEGLKKRVISSASYYFSPSELSDCYLEFYGAKKKNIIRYPFSSLHRNEILSDPVDKKVKDKLKKKLGIIHKNMVMTVGQFIYRKANEVLIEASGDIDSDTEICIIGGKPTAEYLKLVSEKFLTNITFIDFKKKEELRTYYMAADVFVMPTREDIWGLVINEAMAYGLPVVSTDKCIAALELVKNGRNGYIIPPNQPKEIAQKVNLILQNDKLRMQMAAHSIKTIQDYTIENMAIVHKNHFIKMKTIN